MRVAIYVRVSTLEQYKEGYSVAEQIERLTKYCEAKGWTVYKVYIDGGYSGADMDRPALQDMIRDAGLGLFDAVLVYKLDRLSRSQRDTLEIIEDILLPSKVEFVSMTENIDTGTPFGRAMIGILSVFAQLEREQIRERMAMGIEGRAREGKWHGSKNPPVGYDYTGGQLVVIPYEAMMVREAFELFVRRVPVNRICTILEGKGYRHRYGFFKAKTLNSTLRNKLYVGLIEKNGQVYDGQHSAIVSDGLFNQAQALLKEREKSSKNYKHPFKYNSALAGLIRCKRCGSAYCKDTGAKRKDGSRRTAYICYSRCKKNKAYIKDPNCKNRIWETGDLDGIVFGEIRKLAIDPQYLEEIRSLNADDDKPQKVEAIRKRVAELSEQISRYTDLYSLGSLTMDEIREKITPLTSERQSLNEELMRLQDDSNAAVGRTMEVVKSFGDILEAGNLDDIRFVVEELVSGIDIDGENVTIHWSFI